MVLPDNYKLEFKRVKHARIRISENLSVRVIVPENFENIDIENLIKKKQNWIETNLNKFKSKTEKIKLMNNQILLYGEKFNFIYCSDILENFNINPEQKIIKSKTNLNNPDEQLKWYKRYAKIYLSKRLKEIAYKHNFKYNKIYIRNQRTKWGNCSTKRNISFNWRLIKTPHFVIDYIICHELLHTLIMSHTLNFWTEMKFLYPNYKESILWLDKYGNDL